MKCSSCKKMRGGAYMDYCKTSDGYFNFNLCYDCCKLLDFIPNTEKNLKKCLKCEKYFVQNKEWQTQCLECYFEEKGIKKDNNFQEKEKEEVICQEVLK